MSNKYTNFEEFKKSVLSKKVGRKTVSVKELTIVSDDCIEYLNLPFAVKKEAFRSLLRILNISKKVREQLKSSFGNKGASHIISALSETCSTTNGDIVMLLDMRNNTIINFLKSKDDMVANEVYLNQIERVIDASNLEVDELIVRANGGFSISTIGDNTEWGLKGVESTESFKFGLNFDNDPLKGTRLMPYNQRLICTNGMIGNGFTGVHQLTNERESWDEFYKKISILKKDNFKPVEFSPKLQSIMKSTASLSEVLMARNLLKSNSEITDQSLELYVPILSTEEAYQKEGILIRNLNSDQLKNAQTDLKYWDLINGCTNLASHNYGYNMKNPDIIKRAAGTMFLKTPDLSNLVKNPFDK